MFRSTPAIISLAALLLIAVAITGCSDPAEKELARPHAYRSDLENTVALAIRRGNDDVDLIRRIDAVARRHGLNDWAEDEETFAAIGVGLRDAGAPVGVAESVAEVVSRGDARLRDLVMQAYGG